MSQQTLPFIEGKYGWNLGESGWNGGMDENLIKFSFLFDSNIDGIVSSLPPAVNGTAYFNTTDKRVYFVVGNVYYSSPVPKWFQLTLRSTGLIYQYDGSTLVEIDSLSGIDTRLVEAETSINLLGSAAFEDTSAFASPSSVSSAVASLETDIATSNDNTKGAYQTGYRGRTVGASLDDVINVRDYGVIGNNSTSDSSAITTLESTLSSSGGGLLLFPSAPGYLGDPAPAVGNVAREYNGPNSIGSSYADGDNLAVAAKLFRYADATNHVGKEGYTVFVESRPKGSTDGTVPGSDFGLGISVLKQNWTNSSVEGQNCGVNIVTRGGYFNQQRVITNITQANPAVVTTATPHGYSNGDLVIIQNVLGMYQVNASGKFTVANVTANTFQLSGVNSTSYNAYLSGGTVQKDSGVAGFYNPGDTATYIANTVQSSANSFSAQFEGASYYMPGGQFISGTRGIRVQLGAIKHSENLGIGVLAVSSNGANGAAFQAQNSRADVGIEGTWTKAFSYITDFGAGAYEAFQINQLGQIVLHGGTSATTPKKTIRASQTNGQLEVVNDANSLIIMNLTDAGAMSVRTSYQVLGTQVVGARDTGWTAFTGSTNKATAYVTSTITLQQLAERVAALQAACTAHGLIG